MQMMSRLSDTIPNIIFSGMTKSDRMNEKNEAQSVKDVSER